MRTDRQRGNQCGTRHAGSAAVHERREPDPGEREGANIERQQVPGRLVGNRREDRAGDDDVGSEVARPEPGAGRRAVRSPPGRDRAERGEREDESLAPAQAAGRGVREQLQVVVPGLGVAGWIDPAIEIGARRTERFENGCRRGEERRIEERRDGRGDGDADKDRAGPAAIGQRVPRPPGSG